MIKVGHHQLTEFEMIAMMNLIFAQTIFSYINFSDQALLSCSRSGLLNVWMKKCNTINNVIYAVSIKDRFQP